MRRFLASGLLHCHAALAESGQPDGDAALQPAPGAGGLSGAGAGPQRQGAAGRRGGLIFSAVSGVAVFLGVDSWSILLKHRSFKAGSVSNLGFGCPEKKDIWKEWDRYRYLDS